MVKIGNFKHEGSIVKIVPIICALFCITISEFSYSTTSSPYFFVRSLVCSPSTDHRIRHCCDDTICYCCDGTVFGKTFFSFRPQDSDSTRRILEYFNNEPITNQFTTTLQFQRSFYSTPLAAWFFFNGTPTMSVGIPNDTESFDIDGNQIGLSLDTVATTTFQPGTIGTIRACPWLENIVGDLSFYYNLDTIAPRLWTQITVVLAAMRTSLRLQTTGQGLAEQDFQAGLFSLDGIGTSTCQPTPVPYTCITDALQGKTGWGEVPPLFFGNFTTKTMSKFGVAGVHLDLGYDIYNSENGYIGAAFHTVFPTGTKPTAHHIFEPIIGANKSWQVGATIMANWLPHQEVGFYLYFIGSHLFKAAQRRVFALKNNGPGSQLLLTKKFNPANTALEGADRVANILAGTTGIGADFMFDGSAMIQCNHRTFFFNLGYNFWLRTKEKRSSTVYLNNFYPNQVALKGNQFMAAEQTIGCNTETPLCCYDLTTASKSTIATPAAADECPTFLTPEEIDYGAALHPTCWSHKIFLATGCTAPCIIEVAGTVEFGTKNSAVNQWGLLLKLGTDF
jgi:hypothetical protein